jgi:hypothetical protein
MLLPGKLIGAWDLIEISDHEAAESISPGHYRNAGCNRRPFSLPPNSLKLSQAGIA